MRNTPITTPSWHRVQDEEVVDFSSSVGSEQVPKQGGVHLLGKYVSVPSISSFRSFDLQNASRSSMIYWVFKVFTMLLCLLMFITSIIGTDI